VQFHERLDALRGRDDVVHLRRRHPLVAQPAQRDARERDPRPIVGEDVGAAWEPGVGREPRLHEKHAARLQMACERVRGGGETVGAADEADRAEEAGDDVEAPAQVEVAHVGAMQPEAGEARPGDREQSLVDVHALAGELVTQVLEVLPGPARDVEQRPRLRPPFAHEARECGCFRGVVLERVLEVVEIGARGIRHRAESVTTS
jgi:hypothetical protein